MFSICLCAWNDLEYLKILYRGVQRNTKFPYEFIVHDNGSTDNTTGWLKENGIKYSRSDTNLGVGAVNLAVNMATQPYIIDINADMYPLPGWDTEIAKQIRKLQSEGNKRFTISSCLIEPVGDNPEYVIRNFGTSHKNFDEDGILGFFGKEGPRFGKEDAIQYSHPICMPKTLWDEFGGVDMSYPYGIATDHDIPASAYSVGCRNFVMLAKSRVYHFVTQTVRKLPPRSSNEEVFKTKWGMSIGEFREKMNVKQPYRRVPDDIF